MARQPCSFDYLLNNVRHPFGSAQSCLHLWPDLRLKLYFLPMRLVEALTISIAQLSAFANLQNLEALARRAAHHSIT